MELGEIEAAKAALAEGEGTLALLRLLAHAQTCKRAPPQLQQCVDLLSMRDILDENSATGFAGSTLFVRPPEQGTEWLGSVAAPDALLDDPEFYEDAAHANAQGAISLAGPANNLHLPWHPGNSTEADNRGRAMLLSKHRPRPRGYRCLADAVQAASAGDRIMLMEGTHPTGCSAGGGIVIDKRLLIYGQEGKQVILDHRANHPLLRIKGGGAVLRGFKIDMIGFREAVRIEGRQDSSLPSHCCLLLDLDVSSSGGDAVVVLGGITALLQGCRLQGRKCSLRTMTESILEEFRSPMSLFCPKVVPQQATDKLSYQSAFQSTGLPKIMMRGCIVQGSEVGLFLSGKAYAALEDTRVSACGQEGVVATERSSVLVCRSSIEGCGGPGIDGSGASKVTLVDSTVKGRGGIWIWGSSRGQVLGEHSCVKSNDALAPAFIVHGSSRMDDQASESQDVEMKKASTKNVRGPI